MKDKQDTALAAPPSPDAPPPPGSVLAELCQAPGNRCRIMLEAARLFTRKGFAATSVREIVEASGVTKPTLYYYFKNKDDLFLSILDFAIASYFAALDAGIAAPGGARQRIHTFVQVLAELFASNLDILRFVHAAFYGPQDSTPRFDIKTAHERLHAKLGLLLEGLATEGGMAPEDGPALDMLLPGLLEAIQCQIMKQDFVPVPTREQVARCVDLLLDGAAARAAAR
ncbi:MAG: TetR/AcrR family transcriptional regulator [Thermodesulfobacteriota bacterium]